MESLQLSLFSQDKDVSLGELNDFLNDKAPVSVSVVLTRNSVSMLSIDMSGRRIIIRIHESFISAPQTVLRALKRYLRTRRRKDWRIVSAFASQIHADSGTKRKAEKLRTKGDVYDLHTISKSVNDEFFSGRVKCKIGWSRGRTERSRKRTRGRYLRFGSWVQATRTVKVHPILDDTRVPLEFVRYIVFHEMLHAVVPNTIKNGRSYDHSQQFKKLERAYPDFPKMKQIAKRIVEDFL